jgi:betaine-aldehyde dehydrogenase
VYVESDGPVLESRYPATGEVIASLRAADDALVERTVSIAADAQRAWASTPPVERGRVLRRAADLIRERNRDLSVIETLDTGKPLQETLVADAMSGADCLEHFGNLIATDTSDHIPLGGAAGSSFAYTRREPLGVCAGHRGLELPDPDRLLEGGAGTRLRQRDDLQALGADPARRAQTVGEILAEAGLPDGVFNVVQGFGETGAALCPATPASRRSP